MSDRVQRRLNINLGKGPAAALDQLAESKDITDTEVIRRALSLMKFVEDEKAKGWRLALLSGHGEDEMLREVIFPDV